MVLNINNSRPSEQKSQGENFNVEKARQEVLAEIKRQPQVLAKPVQAGKLLAAKEAIKKMEVQAEASQPKIMPKSKNIEEKKVKSVVLKVLGIIILFGIIAVCLIILITVYLIKSRPPIADGISRFLALPAAYINGKPVKVYAFDKDVDALKKYLSRNQASVSESDARKMALDTLVELTVIKKMADDYGLTISQEEINQSLEKIMQDSQINDVERMTSELYGWDFATFKEKVLMPLVLRQKVEERFNQLNGGEQALSRLKEIKNILADDDSRFSKIAAEVNQDESAKTAGELGWLKLGETAPEFEFQLLNLQPGQFSEIVETGFGYHLIRLDDKAESADGQLNFKASQIFFKKVSFEQFLENEVKKTKVIKLIRF